MNQNIKDMKYIEISDCFNLDSYYKTDLHIKQDEYPKAVNKIFKEINNEEIDFSEFKKEKITDFYGVYYGQALIYVGKDEIYILKDENIEKSVVYNYENNKESEVYNLEKLNSKDLYDIFLSGATPLIEINNKNVENGKEIIIFRDSFASAFCPLILKGYSKMTLVDLRYISSDILDKFIEFKNQDVLFLYNDLILNNSSMLK